ncbi:calcium-binding protein [Rhizobium sp. LjRoot254]|uniref:calcium-binding protein n=1 Tax=Rhizobium sp. LjRoot254 TaxID=3342297 RepID=UPI003ECE43ED
MINVTFGAAGASDFNVSNFVFQALTGASFKVEFQEGTGEALDSVRFYSGKNDYVELKGQFNAEDPVDQETASLLDNVETVASYKVVANGKVAFQISGLEIGADQLHSFKALGNYLAGSDYQITGNNAANDLYTADGADKLNGLDGNDFLFSGAGDDALLGGKGNDRFEAGKGNDSINDKIGADTLIFHRGDGTDSVTGFNFVGKGHDNIDLSEYFGGDKELRFKDLDISRQGKSDVVIDLDGADQIVLHGVTTKQIDASDFQF